MDILIQNEYDFVIAQWMIAEIETGLKKNRMAAEGDLLSSGEMVEANLKMTYGVLNYLKANVNAYKPGTYQNVNSGRSSETTRN